MSDGAFVQWLAGVCLASSFFGSLFALFAFEWFLSLRQWIYRRFVRDNRPSLNPFRE